MPIQDFYKHDYTIYSNSGSFDANGDWDETASEFATGKCKLTPKAGNKAIRLSDKKEVWANYRIYMDPVAGIDEFKNITIDGNVYQMLFIADRLGRFLEIDALGIS